MKYQPIFGFSGINTHVSPFLTAEGELAEAQNFVTSKIGTLTKTGDYTIKGAQITSGQNILGGFDFTRASGTHEHIIAIDGASNAGIYKYVTDTWTTQSQSLTATKKVRFAYSPTLDTLFAVNESDATRSYNGTSWSTSTNVTSAPKGKNIFAFGRRIYILNATVGATTYATRAYRSSLVDSGSIAWDTTNDWFTFDDSLVGATKCGNNALFMAENSGHILTLNDEKYQITTKGCVSADSVCSYNEWGFWAALDGFYGTNGGTPQKLSLPIEEYWKGIPYANMASIQAKVIDDNIVVYIGDITAPATLSNVAFIYDINQNDWNRLYLADNVLNLHTYVTSSGTALFMGNDDGEIFQMFTGGDQNGVAIPAFVESNWLYGSGPRIVDDWREIWGYGEKLSSLKVLYKVDNGDWKSAGELNGSTDLVKLPNGTRGYRFKIRFQETSLDNLYELNQIEIGFEQAYDKADREP